MARAAEFTAVALRSRGILATALRTGTVDELALEVAVSDLRYNLWNVVGFPETVTLADWWENALQSASGNDQRITVSLDAVWRGLPSTERHQALVAFFSHIIETVVDIKSILESTEFHGYDIRHLAWDSHLAWDGSEMDEADIAEVLDSLLHLNADQQALLGVAGGGNLHDLLTALHPPQGHTS
jgi:hypothetical protein